MGIVWGVLQQTARRTGDEVIILELLIAGVNPKASIYLTFDIAMLDVHRMM